MKNLNTPLQSKGSKVFDKDGCGLFSVAYQEAGLTPHEEEELATHIVACVNVMQGIEDTNAYMKTANDLILKGGEAMNKLELMQKLVDEYKIKADKWDALENELLKCYERFDDEDNELPSEHEEETGEEANLMTIGEICIKHFELF